MKYPRYPEYKDSGVEWIGEIPEHWKVIKLKSASIFNPPKSEIKGYSGETLVSFFPMESIGDDGKLEHLYFRPISEVINGYTYFKNGDVVVAKITPCFENGKGAIMEGMKSELGFGTTELIVIRPSPILTKSFLYLLTITSLFRNLGEGAMQGAAGQKRVPEGFVSNFKFGLPLLDEQIQISNYVKVITHKIEDLISKIQIMIKLLKEKRQAIITHAVTKGLDPNVPMKDSGVEWIGEIPGHWRVVKIKSTSKLNPLKSEIKSFQRDVLVPFFPMESIGEDGTLEIQHFRPFSEAINGYTYFRNGDVVLAKITPCFENGKGAIIEGLNPDVGFGTTELIVVRPSSELNKSFLYFLTSTNFFRKLGEGAMHGSAGQKRVPEDFVANFKIGLPPQDEQIQIIQYINSEVLKIDHLVMMQQQLLKFLNEYKSSLITQAVTGKIDVRGFVDPTTSDRT